jgi:hypothetical protein
MLNVSDTLLGLVAAAAPDGGDAVVKALAAALAEACPFDMGEIVLARGSSFVRRALHGEETPLSADDLLGHVARARLPVRIDQLDDAEPFPETRTLLRKHGLRSLLAVPFARPAPAGALIITRKMGWGLVGASMHTLVPVATAAGLALHHALTLSELSRAGGAEGGAAARARIEQLESALEHAAQQAERVKPESERLARDLAAVVKERDDLKAETEMLSEEIDRLTAEVNSLVSAMPVDRRKGLAPVPDKRRREDSGK